MSEQNQLLDISWETILKVAFAGLVFYLLYLVRDVVVWFLFGLIISVLFNPAINFLRWFRIPRILAVIVIYLSIFGVLGFIIYFTAPVFVFEIKQFSQSLPEYFEKISPFFKGVGIEALSSVENFTKTLTDNLEQFSVGILNALAGFFGGVASTFFILTIAFFLSLEENVVERTLAVLSPKRHEEYILALFNRCQTKISGWFGARIVACLFVGVITFLVLQLFKIKYAFILGLLAGVLNFVPYLGPLITGILLVLFIGISDTWLKAVFILVIFFLIQQVENNILSPLLTKKFVGLPPVLVLLSLVVGGEIFGLLGAIFAVPVFGILYEFIKEFLEKRKEEEQVL